MERHPWCWKWVLRWPGEASSRLKPGQHMEPSGKRDFLQQGGNKQAGRNPPGWFCHGAQDGLSTLLLSFGFPQFPPTVVPAVAIRPCWRWGRSRMGWASGLCLGQDFCPGGQRHGETRCSPCIPETQPGAQTRAWGALKINSLTWICFYISGRLGSRSASKTKGHLFNGIFETIAPL